MSEVTDCKRSAESASRKRCPSPDRDEGDTVASKSLKVGDELPKVISESRKSNEADSNFKERAESEANSKEGEETAVVQTDGGTGGTGARPGSNSGARCDKNKHPRSPDARTGAQEDTEKKETEELPSTHRSDAAAIVAAEALASLTGGDEEDSETPCSSEKARHMKQGGKLKLKGSQHSSRVGSKTQAVAADSSTSVHSATREDASDLPEGEEGDESLSGSSSTPSSSFPSDNEDNDDGECAIVSVKMAPEMRQSVALLAQVQMRLEALEKKSARLHQRLELKINRQRRPHLDQRSSIAKTIPGFWVTALLNHPHLSAHIDETDEDALSYMTDLEIESFDNNKVGHRIRFHFRRNPYFQNNIIMKEIHVGMRGAPTSFSNPILWHRGQNLTANSEPRKSSRGVYQTFFNWFSDHSNPRQDDVAQILKDDLYRDPLRYYLTPLWEPRENGSGGSGARTADNSKGDECVVISDSDDEPDEDEPNPGNVMEQQQQEEEEEEEDGDDADEEEEEEEEEEDEERGPSAGSDDSEQDDEEP
ncbi:testis specific protein Y-linked isoform X2 [Takifugu rubripes]|uniref:Testis specific protein Y-linked n=1 Tax=Takifugu rubripes TaxID=31033 RepID=A0A3B5KT25_TAKRU|nr:testis-specific Y-encoded-like protein 1 isoform X2 [Takifugu rubripes]|eukprot:XP_011601034.1 PREDICTED: testis-specific Y-encoded-like protein 1 [Takifugu rubripes]